MHKDGRSDSRRLSTRSIGSNKKLDDFQNAGPPHRHETRSSVRNAIQKTVNVLRSLTGSPTGPKIDRRPSLNKAPTKGRAPNPAQDDKGRRRASEPALLLDLGKNQTTAPTPETVANQTKEAHQALPTLLDKRPPTGKNLLNQNTGQVEGAQGGRVDW